MKAINLKTEYLKNPIGIDIPNPRLFWNCEGGKKQTAYRIHAEDEDGAQLWDSGKIPSDKMNAIPYPRNLISRTRVIWRVKLWDEMDKEGTWSAPAFFEMGLLKKNEWQARWITGDYEVDKKTRYPVDCFRKKFAVRGAVRRARLYATACGLYRIQINGKDITMPLAPGITDYRKRIQYQTYDITTLLTENNVIEAQLADGWYRGSCGAWGLKNQYGTETKLLTQLEIFYETGEKQTIVTDGSWQWSNDGALRFADNKDGEIVDARMTPSYRGHAKETSHPVLPVCSNNVPIAEMETFCGRLQTTPGGKKLIDFGQNMAGYIALRIHGHAGQKIVLRFGELLENGELTLRNIQCVGPKITTPLQTIDYTCREGENTYKTSFAIFGFRYMEIVTDLAVKAENFTAIAVYSQMEETGFFRSSNELLDRFVQATKWSTKSNSTDLPTDCPTRERHGWTGDAQIFFQTASYLFDYAAFSQKYLRDVYDQQQKNGKLPQIAPPGGVDFYMAAMDGSVGWADAGVLIPYWFSKQYDDPDLLRTYYEPMKRYARFMQRRCGKIYPTARYSGVHGKNRRYLCNFGQAYGEWAEPADVVPQSWTTCVVTHPETATAYTSLVMECMAAIADRLGKTENAKEFRDFSEGNKKAYQALMKTKRYSLDTDRQARLVRPLALHMLDPQQTAYAQKRLIQALEHYDWRLGTGFLSTPLILDVLTDINPKYAYRLLENEKMPGWLFMTKAGATTIWESWEGTEAQGGIASLNHYSKGAVCEWLFRQMCGIQVAGSNHFVLSPLPGGHFTFAEAEYRSIFGTIKSGWQKESDGYRFTFTIPANCTADLLLPDGTRQTLSAGEYTMTAKG